jgi:hypothetical protein
VITLTAMFKSVPAGLAQPGRGPSEPGLAPTGKFWSGSCPRPRCLERRRLAERLKRLRIACIFRSLVIASRSACLLAARRVLYAADGVLYLAGSFLGFAFRLGLGIAGHLPGTLGALSRIVTMMTNPASRSAAAVKWPERGCGGDVRTSASLSPAIEVTPSARSPIL